MTIRERADVMITKAKTERQSSGNPFIDTAKSFDYWNGYMDALQELKYFMKPRNRESIDDEFIAKHRD